MVSWKKLLKTYADSNFNPQQLTISLSNNWNTLKEQNIKKANFICNDIFDYPGSKDEINQQLIFNCQKEKFVDKDDSVSILSSFPLFLYEYFK